MKKIIVIMMLVCMTTLSYADDMSIMSTHFSLRDTPKYKDGFTHFDYVNPDAPKGGSITLAAIGTFDNFHRYAQRGYAAKGSDQVYDSLMVGSDDEIDVLYPLIAEKVEYSKDYTWIIFHINKNAKFQDGKPITAEDVAFSFNKFFNEGVPQFKSYYKDVDKVEAIDSRQAKFTLKQSRPDLLHSLATNLVLPKHYWESRKFSEPITEVPLGSSGFTIDSYKMGQHVIIKRIKDYWAKDLPVNKGRYNFDSIRYDYYKDTTVALEAFKAGEFDFNTEAEAKQWATRYEGKKFDKQYIIKEEIPHEITQGMPALTFNVQRDIFRDPRVREALIYAMDFEWMNKHLFYNQYTRNRSYFQNTEYEAKGLPSKEELAILDPIKNKIPPRVFTEEYQPPKTDGSGKIRKQFRKAMALLKEAGWQIKDKKMTYVKTGEKLEFELLIHQPSSERIAIPIQDNLKKLGVSMAIRMVDTSQFVNRMRDRKFDMIARGYSAMQFPSSDLKIIWHSKFIDSTWNTAGASDPAIDYLLEQIGENQTNKAALLHMGRALDRVLQWNFFVMPQWYIGHFRVAYWNKFSRPAIRPKYDDGFYDTWWIDKEKEARLPKK